MADPTPPAGGPLAPLERRLQGYERRLRALESPSGTQRGQVLRDLVGRVTHAVDGAGTTETWTAAQPNSQPWGPQLKFTIEEPRVVSIQTALRGVASVLATNSTTAVFALLRGQVFVDAQPVSGAQGEIGVNVGTSPTTAHRQNYNAGTITCRSLITLDAGEHTVQCGFLYRNVEVVGTGGSGYITAADPNLFVDVLQTIA